MMLKIKTGKGANWRIVDNVKEIHYQYFDEAEARRLFADTKGMPCRWIDLFGELKDKRYALVNVTYCDATGELIYTDSAVYVLNDEGKTCDSAGVYD